MKNSLLLIGLLLSANAMAFSDPVTKINISTQSEEKINQRDSQGRKQGKWVVFGKDKPHKGYPDNGKIEEGVYLDNRKHGTWTKYYKDGKTPRIVGEFQHGRPKGEYKKMYETGKVEEEGVFENGKQTGTYKKFFDSGKIAQERNYNSEGIEDGVQKFYYPNGQVEFEFTKKEGINSGTSYRYTEDGQVEEVITYAENGKVSSREKKEVTDTQIAEAGKGGPDGAGGNMRGMVFERDGYNKVYNENEELWLDGKFKNGKLWDGKLYKYDADGILLKIEVWKDGKYNSDGQL